jgi:hypothetical protein
MICDCVGSPGTIQTEMYEIHGERNAQRMVHDDISMFSDKYHLCKQFKVLVNEDFVNSEIKYRKYVHPLFYHECYAN